MAVAFAAKINKIMGEILGNTIYIKCLYVILMIALSCVYFENILGPFSKILLVYGIAIVVYHLVAARDMFRHRYMGVVVAFCFFLGVSVLVNYDNGFVENAKSFLYTLLEFFVILLIPQEKTREKVTFEFKLLSGIALGLLLIISLVALFTFIFQIQIPIANNEYVGTSHYSRLAGISGNPNMLGMLMIFQLYFIMAFLALGKSKKRWLLLFAAFPGIACLMLSGSRGAQLAFFCALAVFSFFLFLSEKRGILSAKKVFKSIALTMVLLLAFWGSANVIQYSLGFVPPVVEKYVSVEFADTVHFSGNDIVEDTEKDASKSQVRVDTKRTDVDYSQMGSGRLDIWTALLNVSKAHPLFGVGYAELTDFVAEYNCDIYLQGFSRGNAHNIYLQILVSSGILALISFLVMLVFFAVKSFLLLFRFLKSLSQYTFLLVLMISGISMILVHQFVEMQMIYIHTITSAMFVIFLGYIQYILEKHDGKRSDL